MKSKAKRNNNRPASFREKCRNAFAGAIKGLANINAAEKENVAASFDLDKRSVERRIDAMEKNRAVAKRIAEGCIKGDPSFNFDDEWIAINILMDPPYNVGEEMFCYSVFRTEEPAYSGTQLAVEQRLSGRKTFSLNGG